MSDSSPILMQRIVAGIALGIAFLLMASIFSPDRSHARDDQHGQDSARHADGHAEYDGSDFHSADVHHGLQSLGTIETGRLSIMIFSTPDGPRYSIIDHDGYELGTLLTAEQVTDRFPEIPLTTLEFDSGTELMSAESDDVDW